MTFYFMRDLRCKSFHYHKDEANYIYNKKLKQKTIQIAWERSFFEVSLINSFKASIKISTAHIKKSFAEKWKNFTGKETPSKFLSHLFSLNANFCLTAFLRSAYKNTLNYSIPKTLSLIKICVAILQAYRSDINLFIKILNSRLSGIFPENSMKGVNTYHGAMSSFLRKDYFVAFSTQKKAFCMSLPASSLNRMIE